MSTPVPPLGHTYIDTHKYVHICTNLHTCVYTILHNTSGASSHTSILQHHHAAGTLFYAATTAPPRDDGFGTSSGERSGRASACASLGGGGGGPTHHHAPAPASAAAAAGTAPLPSHFTFLNDGLEDDPDDATTIFSNSGGSFLAAGGNGVGVATRMDGGPYVVSILLLCVCVCVFWGLFEAQKRK